MMTTEQLSKALIAPALIAALSACAARPEAHFYSVSSTSAAPGSGAQPPRILVSPVVIPPMIDRPQMVVQTTGHEIEVLENHRWAEPLSVDLGRALVDDLRRARPQLDVVTADAPRTQAPTFFLDIAIAQLLTGPSSTSLQASWVLHDRQRNCVYGGHLEAAIPTQAGYGAIAAAYADAMARLADAIARTIPEEGACGGGGRS